MAAPHILYYVHDVSDPAVAKRVAMLKAGGATLCIIGFRRTAVPVTSIAECSVIDLGRTHNGKFLHRMLSVCLRAITMKKTLKNIQLPTVILARNLEMLALAVRAQKYVSVPLTYESLDIHRLLLRDDIIGTLLRKLEGALSKKAHLLITSSPAFINEYFIPKSHVSLPALIVENKIYPPATPMPRSVPSKPYTIGWFGAIRCRQSLDILDAATTHAKGEITVTLRGKPALDQFDDFHAQIAQNPYLNFHGAYDYSELAEHYSNVDFNWVIDRFEQGQNSSWLLPNRLYEGSLHGAIPIAERSGQIANFLKQHTIGIILPEWSKDALMTCIQNADISQVTQHAKKIAAINPAQWQYHDDDCAKLVRALQSPASINSEPHQPKTHSANL